MADFNYGGTDEESAEIKKLNDEVITKHPLMLQLEDIDNFENWEKLVRAVETLEGGLNRNSSPQAIATTRDAYDRFLAKFPLLFGYWKKYADLEFSIAGTEAAEMVFERGVASITTSVDLWTDYCAFKVETCHDPDVIRELFERSANSVGLDFLAHPFWDKYLEFEDRLEASDRIFSILNRVIKIPMHQYARYFERFRQLAHTRPLHELVPIETLSQFRAEVESDGFQAGPKGELEIERELRLKVDNYYLETFTSTQTETTKRWTYESEIKRPYFHVTELDNQQLTNWRKYLDFEEAEGNYTRCVFLYERCLVTCAFYDEFWFRYVRWMSAQEGKQEEVRNIYQRASTFYVPISRPGIRLQYAYFEEMSDRVDVARDIHDAILDRMPGHVETVISWANLERRQFGIDAAIQVYQNQIDNPLVDIFAKAAFAVEWAILLWKIKGSIEEARQVFQSNQQWYLNSRHFWMKYLEFELAQPTTVEEEEKNYARIKQVHQDMLMKTKMSLATKRELSGTYLMYLQQRGTKEAMKEFLQIDKELNGPLSIQPSYLQAKFSSTRVLNKSLENGQPVLELDEESLRKGEARYTVYFQENRPLQLNAPQSLAPFT
ncbi:Pre-mRNA-processing factor 39 [Golovinomyces cichoracearum]|uniref:Pre-mRNA-processing factor 39 n=1 Tax=Golovinomyces cichoracearum TaxID=62708 RepID=A0A420IEW4_9PEZI|nr:Pre-mRNA-processing factor 39 [Golovinomyces cichoracearum]